MITPPYGPKPDVAGVAYDQMPEPLGTCAAHAQSAPHVERWTCAGSWSPLPQPTPPEPLSDEEVTLMRHDAELLNDTTFLGRLIATIDAKDAEIALLKSRLMELEA